MLGLTVSTFVLVAMLGLTASTFALVAIVCLAASTFVLVAMFGLTVLNLQVLVTLLHALLLAK